MVLWNLIKMTLFLEITALPCWRRLQEQTADGPPEWKVCDMEGTCDKLVFFLFFFPLPLGFILLPGGQRFRNFNRFPLRFLRQGKVTGIWVHETEGDERFLGGGNGSVLVPGAALS